MRRHTAWIIVCILLALSSFYYNSVKKAFAAYDFIGNCELGRVIVGSCHNATGYGYNYSVPPDAAPPYTNGTASCDELAEAYSGTTGINVTATCENKCTYQLHGDDICRNQATYDGLCERTFPFLGSPQDKSCTSLDPTSGGPDRYCCRYAVAAPPPPPPPTLWMISGIVFYDKNDDGAINGSDTVYGNGAGIDITDETGGGTPNSTAYTDSTGYYETSRMWPHTHRITVSLNASLPSGCYLRSSTPSPNSFNISSDTTVKFAIICPSAPPDPTCSDNVLGVNQASCTSSCGTYDVNFGQVDCSAGQTCCIHGSPPSTGCRNDDDCIDENPCTTEKCDLIRNECETPTNKNDGTSCSYDFYTNAATGWCCSGSCGPDKSCSPPNPGMCQGDTYGHQPEYFVNGKSCSGDGTPNYSSSGNIVSYNFAGIFGWQNLYGESQLCNDNSQAVCNSGYYNDDNWFCTSYSCPDGNPPHHPLIANYSGGNNQASPWGNGQHGRCFTNTCYTNNLSARQIYYPSGYCNLGKSTFNDCDPGNVCVNGSCVPPSQAPTCSSAGPDNVTETTATHTVYAYDVTNATSVTFPTWSDVNGQDDLIWYNGIDLGDGTWAAVIPHSSHRSGNPDLGQFYTHVYMNNAGNTNVWCDSANFTWSALAPPPAPCQVTTSPVTQSLAVGGAHGTITASVTSGLGSATVSQMAFGSYNTSIATVNPTIDSLSPYSTSITAVAEGNAAVWATATLSDGRICQTTGATDTNISTNSLYSISGRIFNDPANTQSSTGAETSIYRESFTITSVLNSTGTSVGTVAKATVPGDPGSYTINGLSAGEYRIKFSGLPAGYDFTYPQTPENTLIVSVGPCSPSLPGEATCDDGNNIADLNAGVTNIKDPWFQSKGSDMRYDPGFTIGTNPLPSSSSYASVPNPPNSLMAGVIFSGRTKPVFSPGNASYPFDWQVGSSDNPDIFTTNHNTIPTSYEFLMETARGSGVPMTPITLIDNTTSASTYGHITAHGVYTIGSSDTDTTYISSDVKFDSDQIGSGNFIILVKGDLSIDANITVPVGSTVIFSVSGNIIICPTCTENIQGIYSADGSFTVQGISDLSPAGSCPTKDIPLNIEGAVVANAGRKGGTFINHRSLCSENYTTPVITFTERPDFLINYPEFIKQNNNFWQELAP
jgi:hypothetical protein